MMNCSKAESMIGRYIDHALPLEELEDFLAHIETCSSCYDELETHFIVHEAMQQLDAEDEDASMDFQHLLELDIKKSHAYIRKCRFARFFMGLGLLLLVVLLVGFFIFVFFEVGHFI